MKSSRSRRCIAGMRGICWPHSARAQDYRLYKLARMERLELAGAAARRASLAAGDSRPDAGRFPPVAGNRAALRRRLARGRALEYLNADVLEELPAAVRGCGFCAPEEEHFWLGTVLALGGGVEIERPESKRAQGARGPRGTIVALYSDEGKALPQRGARVRRGGGGGLKNPCREAAAPRPFGPLGKERSGFLSKRSAKISRPARNHARLLVAIACYAGSRGGNRSNQRRGDAIVKRELGIARCGLACCLCTENAKLRRMRPVRAGRGMRQPALYVGARPRPLLRVPGRRASAKRGCSARSSPARSRALRGRTAEAALLDRLEAGERDGMVYHRAGVEGDYDAFPSAEALIAFLERGRPPCANGGKMV